MRSITGISIGIAIICSMIFSSCKISEQESIKLAYEAGRFSTLSWIMIDNPSEEVKNIVKDINSLIKESSDSVSIDKSYSEVLIPIIMTEIIPKISDEFKTPTIAASIAILGGLDVFFLYNPKLKEHSIQSAKIVASFCNGSNDALSIKQNNLIDESILKSYKNRTKLLDNRQGYIESFK